MSTPRHDLSGRLASDVGSFGALLRAYRDAGGLTQEELAARSGLSVDAIGMLERGVRRAPRSSTVQLLAQTLGLEPEQREALVAAARLGAAAASAGLTAHLPVELRPPSDGLIGREEALMEVRRLFDRADVRLVTLTGPPGVGKTRLAVEAALHGAGGVAVAVHAVGLASVSDPGQVGSAICRALGVRELAGQRPVETIGGHLRSRPVLLLLDNLEHLLPVTTLLLELLAACPRLRLLVTSRTSLSLRDEHVVTVSPLALADAVRLFVQQASARMPAFTLDVRNRSSVTEVCRRLDGLPLALQLAAAWVELLGTDGLVAHLAHPLSLLERGPADLPERQRTLRDTLRWSHELLSADGQAAFRRLAVFAGAATLEAAELVCQAPGPLRGGGLPVVAELVDHHLLVAEAGTEPRVSMLHVVREFARELLDASGERAAAEAARLGHLTELVRAAETGLAGERQSAWLERLARDHQDLRGALRWAEEHDVEGGLRLAAGLGRYWDLRGHCEEGDEWLERLLGSGTPVPPGLQAESLFVSGWMRLRLCRYGACAHSFRAAAELFELTGDGGGVARALNGTATVELRQGRTANAIGMFERALGLYRARDDRVGMATVLDNMGLAAKQQGDLTRAMELHLEALDSRRAAGDRFGVCMTLNNLSDVAVRQGRHELADGWLAESVAVARQLGARRSLSSAEGLLGELAGAREAHAEAAAHYRECLRISDEIGEPLNVIRALGSLALASARQGLDRRAARLAGATVSLQEACGMPHPVVTWPEWDQVLAGVQNRVGSAGYRAAWAAGAALSIGEATAEAVVP